MTGVQTCALPIWMVAYLRGVRDYLNAFEYGVDQDAIIEIVKASGYQPQ